jgi:hypothetical protein
MRCVIKDKANSANNNIVLTLVATVSTVQRFL